MLEVIFLYGAEYNVSAGSEEEVRIGIMYNVKDRIALSTFST